MSVFEIDHAFRPHIPGTDRSAELRDMLALVDERESLAAALVAQPGFLTHDVLEAVEMHATHAAWALADADECVTVDVRPTFDAVHVHVVIGAEPGFDWILDR